MEREVTLSAEQVVQWLSEPLHAWIVGGVALVYLVGCCVIFARAGWPFFLGILMIVPGVNLVPFLLLAFFPWPTLNELYRLRRLSKVVSVAGKRYSRAA